VGTPPTDTGLRAKHAWNYIDRDLGFSASWCIATVVAQPGMGYDPTGGVGLVLFIVVKLLVRGRI